ncbi:hypothetical protein B0T14DRAFT_517538 [Immersiella caudata]|uniref:C2H2-type domain-containing protein n=1 Tax=Immersiella caudata TaxID=314043 RepID=A0AA40C3K7_9PEZI|nr:hypothetical protein B0T14DRAFT_517538 [Immersiella caudata]
MATEARPVETADVAALSAHIREAIRRALRILPDCTYIGFTTPSLPLYRILLSALLSALPAWNFSSVPLSLGDRFIREAREAQEQEKPRDHMEEGQIVALDLKTLSRYDCKEIIVGCDSLIAGNLPIYGTSTGGICSFGNKGRSGTTLTWTPWGCYSDDAFLFFHQLRDIARELLQYWDDTAEMVMYYFLVRLPLLDNAALFGLVSPLSSGMRRLKLCLSMPWALSPALVVLWGVCWRFYSGDGIDRTQSALQDVLDPSEALDLIDFVPDVLHQGETSQGRYTTTDRSYCDADNDPVDLSALWPDNTLAFEYNDNLGWLDDLSFPTTAAIALDQFPHDGTFVQGGTLSLETPTVESFISPIPQPGQHYHLGQPPVAAHSPPTSAPTAAFDLVTPSVVLENTKQASPRATQRRQSQISTLLARSAAAARVTKPRGTGSVPSARTPTCPDCGERFSRQDTLKRHMSEQKHGQGLATSSGSRLREFLCPTVGYQRSIATFGFKRQSHVRDHLKNCGKTDSVGSSAAVPAPSRTFLFPAARTDSPVLDRVEASRVCGRTTGDSALSDNGQLAQDEAATPYFDAESFGGGISTQDQDGDGKLSEEDRVSILERCYCAEEEELFRLEQECHRRRERLRHMKGLIGMFRESSG